MIDIECDDLDCEIDIWFASRPKNKSKLICRKNSSVCSNCLYNNIVDECPLDLEVVKTIDKDTFYCTNFKER